MSAEPDLENVRAFIGNRFGYKLSRQFIQRRRRRIFFYIAQAMHPLSKFRNLPVAIGAPASIEWTCHRRVDA